MALDSDTGTRKPPLSVLAREWLAVAVARARPWLDRWVLSTWAIDWLRTTRLHKWVLAFFGGTLVRRIFFWNLAGLAVLLCGLYYLSNNRQWLTEAKLESLNTQGRIIAEAIAGTTRVDPESITIDPERLFQREGPQIPFRDDGFATLELSIRPERVVPLLKRLVDQHSSTRARIYARDGTLIADSDTLRSRNPASRGEPVPAATEASGRVRLRNRWTQFLSWLKGSDMEVYKDIGTANGSHYLEVRMALAGNTTPMLLVSDQGEQIVSVAVPIQRMKSVQGALLLSTRPGAIEEQLAKELNTIFSFAGMAVIASLLASWVLARTIAGPMGRLSEAAEHVSHNISARRELPVMPGRTDEVGQMAHAFRDMTAALYRRIEASDRFAQDVAHELKNPLTAARSTAETLVRYAKTDEQRNMLAGQIQSELKRLNRLITDIANASRLDAELARQESKPVALRDVVGGVVGVFRDIEKARSKREVELVGDDPASAPPDAFVVAGHDGRLGQVVTNLVDNALSFSPGDGRVVVGLRRSGPEIEITVDDEGPGIQANKLDDIFKRFYSDRPQTDGTVGKNSGLGLSISREIVEAHGGRIWAENRPAQQADLQRARDRDQPELKARRAEGVAGGRFVVRLPAAAAPQ